MKKPLHSVRAGAENVPVREFINGMKLVGAPRTGKTNLLKLTLNDVISLGYPAVVMDAEAGAMRDHVEWRLSLLDEPPPLYVFDPSKRGSVKVRWHESFTGESKMWRFCQNLCGVTAQAERAGNDFFDTMAVRVTYCGTSAATYFGGKPTLRQCIVMTEVPGLIDWMCKRTPHLRPPIESMGKTNAASDVMSTVFKCLAPLRPVAAQMEYATTEISPYTDDGVLVLVRRDEEPIAWERLTTLLVDDRHEHRLSGHGKGLVFEFFDEIQTASPQRTLSTVARRGGKTGVCVVITLHELEGFLNRYGEKEGTEILSLLSHTMVVRTNGHGTAEYLAKVMGRNEGLREFERPDGSLARDFAEHWLVAPEEFRTIPRPNFSRDEMRYIGHTPDGGPVRGTVAWVNDVVPGDDWQPSIWPDLPPGSDRLKKFTLDDAMELKFPVADKELREMLK